VRDGRVAALGRTCLRPAGATVIDCNGPLADAGPARHPHPISTSKWNWRRSCRRRCHGTTTVVMSNCSLGVAYGNQRRNGDDPIVDCFARVENVPKHVLRKVGPRCTVNDSADYWSHFDSLHSAQR